MGKSEVRTKEYYIKRCKPSDERFCITNQHIEYLSHLRFDWVSQEGSLLYKPEFDSTRLFKNNMTIHQVYAKVFKIILRQNKLIPSDYIKALDFHNDFYKVLNIIIDNKKCRHGLYCHITIAEGTHNAYKKWVRIGDLPKKKLQ